MPSMSSLNVSLTTYQVSTQGERGGGGMTIAVDRPRDDVAVRRVRHVPVHNERLIKLRTLHALKGWHVTRLHMCIDVQRYMHRYAQ